MVKRLITSDWQLDDSPRDRYRTDFVIKELPELLNKYRPDQLLILGDICEKKDQHPARLVNELVNTLHDITENQGVQIIILQGNHDFLHNGHPFFEFLQNFAGITWVSQPEVLDNCLYLPHTRDYKKDWKGIDFKGHDFIFAHNIFEGVKANGQKLSGIPTKIFPEDAMVISGDVHEPQSFSCITYVGSPCLCDYGDDYIPRVLLLDGLNAKSIKVHGVQKRLINCAVNKITGQRELAFDHNANPNDIVKIRVALTMEDVAHWGTIRKEIEDWGAAQQFVVNTIQPVVSVEYGTKQTIVKSNRKSDFQYFDRFVKRIGIDNKTAQIGRDLL